ncbi:hypothetical protein JXB41_02590 [Candidatus Woesearchaeota archaeon]|nr:hypothetical protein [Candidatus Woesearchaeota archaeon]
MSIQTLTQKISELDAARVLEYSNIYNTDVKFDAHQDVEKQVPEGCFKKIFEEGMGIEQYIEELPGRETIDFHTEFAKSLLFQAQTKGVNLYQKKDFMQYFLSVIEANMDWASKAELLSVDVLKSVEPAALPDNFGKRIISAYFNASSLAGSTADYLAENGDFTLPGLLYSLAIQADRLSGHSYGPELVDDWVDKRAKFLFRRKATLWPCY